MSERLREGAKSWGDGELLNRRTVMLGALSMLAGGTATFGLSRISNIKDSDQVVKLFSGLRGVQIDKASKSCGEISADYILTVDKKTIASQSWGRLPEILNGGDFYVMADKDIESLNSRQDKFITNLNGPTETDRENVVANHMVNIPGYILFGAAIHYAAKAVWPTMIQPRRNYLAATRPLQNAIIAGVGAISAASMSAITQGGIYKNKLCAKPSFPHLTNIPSGKELNKTVIFLTVK